jgi:hypothetical protein
MPLLRLKIEEGRRKKEEGRLKIKGKGVQT